jgi:hypothetical protein
MHVHTVVKVRAENAGEAISGVIALLTDNGEYHIDPFDYVAEDETKISATVKTEADFQKLREMERGAYRKSQALRGRDGREHAGLLSSQGGRVP